jgi:DNA polymerase III epsilon subunit-like protein
MTSNDNNIGKIWTKQEDDLLNRLYNIDKINLIEISLIHQRAPGGIISRLLKNKIINDKKEIRGYDEYLKLETISQSIVNIPKETITQSKFASTRGKTSKLNDEINDEKNDKIITINDNEYILNTNTVYEIKKVKSNIYGYYDTQTNTVKILKSNIKKIITYLNSKSDLTANILWAGTDLDIIKKHCPTFNFTNISTMLDNSAISANSNFSICIINNYITQTNIVELIKLIPLLNNNGDIIILDNKIYYSEINELIVNNNFKIMNNKPDFTNKLFFFELIKKHIIKKMNIMILDTETTGFPASKDPTELYKFNNARLIELGYIIYDSSGKKIKEYDSLVKPNNFVIANTYIHGISQQIATSTGKSILAVLNELSTDLDTIDAFVCHNISFDMNIILSEAHRAKMIDLVKKIESKEKLCTMDLGKKFMKLNKSPKLIELYKFLFNKDFIQDHRALSDCVACAACYYDMV